MKRRIQTGAAKARIDSPIRQSPAHSIMESVWGGIAIAMLGIALGQAILYGPSLIGRKILLPLRLLAVPGTYLPLTEQYKNLVPLNTTLSDLVLFMEPERQFVNSEIRAGRIPLWTPYRFAGAPLYTLGFSPPWLLAYLIRSPVVLAWTQLLLAMIAGLGMYYFCRRIFGLGPWPSVVAAWCYPLTGAYVLWVGQWLPAVMCWLPWMLAAVDRTVRKPKGWGGPALCGLTVLILTAGALDVAGQVLLVSGIYSIWCILDEYGAARAFSRRVLRVAATLVLAWTLGFACSAWLLLPMTDYIQSGSRMENRSRGEEERPPVGLKALPQTVLPNIYGSSRYGSFRIGTMILQESSAAAYSGSVTCLVLAPLAWFSRRRRSGIAALAFIGFFSLGWSLGVPGIVQFLRLPLLNMMSHNRLVFVSAFAFTVLGAIGLDVVLRNEIRRRSWLAIPVILLIALCAWSVYRSFALPEPIASRLEALVEKGPIRHIDEPSDVAEIQQTFRKNYLFNAVFCAIGVVLWFQLLGAAATSRLAPALTALLLIQLVHFGYRRSAQTNPALYFPPIPLFNRIAAGPTGRIIGFECLPANLAQSVGIADIRGYDGVDPERIVQLLLISRNVPTAEIPYAATQFLSPAVYSDPDTGSPRLHPVLDMLHVRYVIFRGAPPPGIHPFYTDNDYWVLENDRAMPRAFVPRHVQLMTDAQSRLRAMSLVEFDPRKTAYVEQPVDLSEPSAGTVEIIGDSPHRVNLRARLQTPGLVVLADRWDGGWKAYINGTKVEILRVDHALRAVRAGAGVSMISFVYSPASLHLGLAVSAAGGICWLSWVCILLYRRWNTGRTTVPGAGDVRAGQKKNGSGVQPSRQTRHRSG